MTDCTDLFSRIDLHTLLATRRQVAILWCVDDVQMVRPNLTDDQAWDVLLACKQDGASP